MVWDVYEHRSNQNLQLLREWLQTNEPSALRVSTTYRGVRLGGWIHKIRQQKVQGLLSREKELGLERLGISLGSPRSASFERGIIALKAFTKREGHAFATRDVVEGGFRLGQWLNSQRAKHRAKRLSPGQVKSLESAGVVWDRGEEQYRRGLKALEQYVANHGNGDVPQSYVVEGFPLGSWIGTRRSEFRKKSIDTVKKRELERAGITWVSARKNGQN
jgi:hypothetical protein